MNQTPIEEPRLLNMLWYSATNAIPVDSGTAANACYQITRSSTDDAIVLAHLSEIFGHFTKLFRAAFPTGMTIPIPPSASPRLDAAFREQLRSKGELPPGVPRPPEPMIRPEKPIHIRRYRTVLAEALRLWAQAKSEVLGIPPDPAYNLLPTTPPTPRPYPIPRPVTPRSPAPDSFRDRIPPPPRQNLATPPTPPPPPPRSAGPPPLPPALRPPHVEARPLAPPPKPVPVQKPNLAPSRPPAPPASSSTPRRLLGGSLGEPVDTDDPAVVAISESQPTAPTLLEPQPSKVPATFFPEVTVRRAKVATQYPTQSPIIDTVALKTAECETAEVDSLLADMLGTGDTTPHSNHRNSSR